MPVSGSACGYYTDVSLFGGPSARLGAGQTTPPGDGGTASPSVSLPPGGSSTAVTATDSNGALAAYGPAVVFGGRPPANAKGPMPPSGAMRATTKGKRSVTSSASVKNVGAGPFTASSVSSTCTASTTSGTKGSTTVTRGVLVTATDQDGNATATEPVPAHPPVNHTVQGQISTGDRFKAVFNEQEAGPDGAITVRALHLYLLGPAAKGDVVVAESRARA
jgi:hypothetical protein